VCATTAHALQATIILRNGSHILGGAVAVSRVGAERPALRHSITVHNAEEPRGSYPQHESCAPQEWLRSEIGCSNSFHQSDRRTERLQACREPNLARRWLEPCWPICRERMTRQLPSSSLICPSIFCCGCNLSLLSRPVRKPCDWAGSIY
jgi:hypothetical protein